MSNMWHGELVRLRAVEPDDLPVFRREGVADADDSQLYDDRRYPPLSEEAAKARWDRALKPSEDSDDLTLAIEIVDGDALVGSLSANRCDRLTGSFEIGFGVFAAHRRKGYASEAVQMLMRYQKANTRVNSFNEPSLAVHRRLRFTEEGRNRRAGFSGASTSTSCSSG
ncbi:MAG: GNAT family N-acetyltransferase [Dehalococcoidia bacterium]